MLPYQAGFGSLALCGAAAARGWCRRRYQECSAIGYGNLGGDVSNLNPHRSPIALRVHRIACRAVGCPGRGVSRRCLLRRLGYNGPGNRRRRSRWCSRCFGRLSRNRRAAIIGRVWFFLRSRGPRGWCRRILLGDHCPGILCHRVCYNHGADPPPATLMPPPRLPISPSSMQSF
jgi:hypothetical protein